jgi:hypothetical protein
MFDAVSETTPPITVREKVIRAVLHTYSPNVPQQHQTFSNRAAEELLANVAVYADLTHFADILCRLIREEEPPRLQAVLRMAEAKLKSHH